MPIMTFMLAILILCDALRVNYDFYFYLILQGLIGFSKETDPRSRHGCKRAIKGAVPGTLAWYMMLTIAVHVLICASTR
jgi:hypothetical protein